MKFKELKNEGIVDRLVRLLIAEVLIIGAFFWVGGVWQIVFYVAGIVSLFTSITGFCGLYKVFEIKTFRAESKAAAELKSVFVKVYLKRG